MQSRYAKNWTFKISQMGNAANENSVLMFNCAEISTNILLTTKELELIIGGREYSSIPMPVIQESYDQYKVQQAIQQAA